MKLSLRMALLLSASISISFLSSSCAILSEESRMACEGWNDVAIHGKCGKAMSIVMTPPALAVSAALLPITYPTVFLANGGRMGEWDVLFLLAPGGMLQGGGYFLGTGLGYPVHLCSLPFKESLPQNLSDDEKVSWLMARMPFLDKEEYALLITVSHRELAMKYEEGPRMFGFKDSINKNIENEWSAWSNAGKRGTGVDERRFAMLYWVYWGGDAYLHEEPRAILSKCTGSDWDAIRLWLKESKEGIRLRKKAGKGQQVSMTLAWKAWIEAHGGIEAVAKKADEKDTRTR